MGLPEILIEFKERAQTVRDRSQNGIVAVVLNDDTKSGEGFTSYTVRTAEDIVASHWTTQNKKYLQLILLGNPNRVLVERIGAGAGYDNALARLRNKKWDWLAIPGLAVDDTKEIADWIKLQRNEKKMFKAVLANYAANYEGIVNFATEGIKCGTSEFSAAEYCARIAGLLAGVPMTESVTYKTLSDVTGITESVTPDDDIDAGKFILINDGENVKVGRGITSLTTTSVAQTEDMKNIKTVEIMDLIRNDIKNTFEQNYMGVTNSYDNKIMFVAAINSYFLNLANQGILYSDAQNEAEIDIEAQRKWLSEKGVNVNDMSDDEILHAKTGSYIFVRANITISGALEDLRFAITMA